MNQERIGKFIANRRKENNLTQGELAEKLDISINAVSKCEIGYGARKIIRKPLFISLLRFRVFSHILLLNFQLF